MVSLPLQAELAGLVTLCNLLLGQKDCCYFQVENLAAVPAMRSVGRAPKVVALLFAPPAAVAAVVDEGYVAAAAAVLAAVVYSQSPLGFGLVAADTKSWETAAENWKAAAGLPTGSAVVHSPAGSGLTWERTWD